MASLFAHVAVPLVARRGLDVPDRITRRLDVIAVLVSIWPDLDYATLPFEVRPGDLLGHRGLTHSFLFAAFTALTVLLALYRHRPPPERWRIALFLFVATASHALLDALTNGGQGVAFLAPFSEERFFFPVHPIEVSPIGAAFFSARGLNVMKSEVMWVWLPALAAASIAVSARRRPQRA